MSIKYFAYGSNMSIPRLRDRVSIAGNLGVYKLHGYKLKFHKISQDGSGKCDALRTGLENDFILGIVFEIDEKGKPELDRVEGLNHGYKEETVEVKSINDSSLLEVVIYIATNVYPNLLPYEWYKHHVLIGAREAGFPEEYLQAIEEVTAIEDLDEDRKARELSIYK